MIKNFRRSSSSQTSISKNQKPIFLRIVGKTFNLFGRVVCVPGRRTDEKINRTSCQRIPYYPKEEIYWSKSGAVIWRDEIG